MRFKKSAVLLFTALFLAATLFVVLLETDEVHLTVSVAAEDHQEQLTLWDAGWGQYYVFLPSYADLSQAALQTQSRHPVTIGGQQFYHGSTLSSLETDVTYDLSYPGEDETVWATITFLRTADVASLHIDIASGSLETLHADKNTSETGSLRLYTAQGALDYSGNFQSLSGRGNSTWYLEKKPYNLTLSAEGDLLGMGAAKRWVLLANAYDPTHLRNKIAYDYAGDTGLSYSPDCQWVDLYLNGEYAGLYLLSERNEIHPQRVAISEEGSFLVSKEWEWRMEEQGQPYVSTASMASLRIHQSDLETDALQFLWQSAENAIFAEDGIDSVTGKHWRELIDLDSWARKLLVEEIFANPDASTLSQFFYLDGSEENAKICAGPVWDFDLAMANPSSYDYPAPNMFYASRYGIYGSYWFHYLYQKAEFRDRVMELYQEEFRPLLQQLLDSGISAYAEEVSRSAAMDSRRWYQSDADAATDSLLSYLRERLAFLDRIWIDQEDYITVRVSDRYLGTVLEYVLTPGDTLPQLPVYEDTETLDFDGWYDSHDYVPFDVTQPIYKDTELYLHYYTIEPEAPEYDLSAIPAPEEPEVYTEPLSLRRVAPVVLFLGFFGIVALADLIRSRRRR